MACGRGMRMMTEYILPVPGLTRDLVRSGSALAGRGPGSGPGRGLPVGNLDGPQPDYGALCLHHGLAPRRRTLHRADLRSEAEGRCASGRNVGAYREIQHSNPCVVRGPRAFRGFVASGEANQEMATGLEDFPDRAEQPRMAGCNRANTIQVAPAPGLTRGFVKSGGALASRGPGSGPGREGIE